MAVIHEFRLSFIWTETFLDLLATPQPAGAPMAFLGRRTAYAPAYDQARLNPTGPLGLTLPWEKSAGKTYWTYYLEGKNLSGYMAWKWIVPFRGNVAATVDAPWLPGKLTVNAYYYPHGVALIMTARCIGAFSIDAMAAAAFKIRTDERYTVTWPDHSVSKLSLDGLARELLDRIRLQALGAVPTYSIRSTEPFSVFHVVKGKDVDPKVAIAEDGDVHYALEAMTTWNPNFIDKSQKPAPLTDRAVPEMKNPAIGNVLYMSKRGAGVWCPSRFIPSNKVEHRMGCYHRNLTFSFLQVESISGLARATSKRINAGPPPAGTFGDLIKWASEVLGRSYSGLVDEVYRSATIKKHIALNPWLGDINAMRTAAGQPDLH